VKKIFLVLICCLFATGVYAETKPFQLSLTPEIALQSQTTSIKGLSLNIWGENQQTGFALGFVNGSKGDSSGLSLGLVNYGESYTGAQVGFVNYTSAELIGVQWGWVNYAEKVRGVQLGLVNIAATADKGLQLGLVNIMKESKTWFTEFPREVAPAMVLANWRF